MPKRNKRKGALPTLCLRRSPSTGRELAYATFDGQFVSFGPAGPQAQQRFDEHLARWLANGRRPHGADGTAALPDHAYLIEDLVADYLHHARHYYPDAGGRPSGEFINLRLALDPVLRMFRDLPAAEFGPLALRAVRQAMVDGGKLCRKEINARVHRIRRAFRWAVAEQQVPGSVFDSLRALDPLRMGKTAARESEPVQPVEDPVVHEVASHLCPSVAAMVWFAYWTGARPGEVCALRWSMIDRAGKVWVAEFARHKTAWRGRRRVLQIGPRAQQVILPFLRPGPDRFVFSPQAAVQEQRAAKAAARRTKVPPSQQERARLALEKSSESIAEGYDVAAFRRAIARGVRAANAARIREHLPTALARLAAKDLDAATGARIARLSVAALTNEAGRLHLRQAGVVQLLERGADFEELVEACNQLPLIEKFAPNQLRHAAATRLRREEGLEAARVVLGHARATVTEIYAEIDHARSREIAERLG